MSLDDLHQTKERVRQATDIVDLVGSSIQLRRAGRDFVGLCPWHDDKSPSLRVNPQRQSWKCWVCNIGGDAFSFVMQREAVEFGEALRILADRAGIVLGKNRPYTPAQPGSPGDKATLYQAMAWAELQYHQALLHSGDAEPARQYLMQRGIEPHSIEAFRIGFAPDQWSWLLDRAKSTTFSPQVLQAVDLTQFSEKSRNHYDRFRGRIMFPIRDTQDRPIAFGARVMPGSEDPAKYINSRETKLFTKSDQVYGLNRARDAIRAQDEIVVMEGFTDVIMAHQYGIERAVAVLGTALNERHTRLLKRFAQRVTLVLDGDAAGQRRANEVLELFIAAELDMRILTLPDNLDPCDYLLENGTEAFEAMLASSLDALEHRIRNATRDINLVTDTHAASQALEAILTSVSAAPRGGLREEQILARLAKEFRVPVDQLRTRVAALRKNRRPATMRFANLEATQSAATGSPASPPPAARISDLSPSDRELLEILLVHPDMYPIAMESIWASDLEEGAGRQVYQAMESIEQRGMPVEFTSIMTDVEDPSLKSLLVELEEKGRAKEEDAQEDAILRLNGLIRRYVERRQEPERQEKLAALEKQNLNEQEEMDLLKQLLEQQRIQQGISAPTDG